MRKYPIPIIENKSDVIAIQKPIELTTQYILCTIRKEFGVTPKKIRECDSKTAKAWQLKLVTIFLAVTYKITTIKKLVTEFSNISEEFFNLLMKAPYHSIDLIMLSKIQAKLELYKTLNIPVNLKSNTVLTESELDSLIKAEFGNNFRIEHLVKYDGRVKFADVIGANNAATF